MASPSLYIGKIIEYEQKLFNPKRKKTILKGKKQYIAIARLLW
jgi:hypothetical protein